MKETFDVTGMTCAACQANVTKAVEKLPGVRAVDVSLLGNTMKVEYDADQVDVAQISAAVDRIGYGAIPQKQETKAGKNTLKEQWDARARRMEDEQKERKRHLWWSIALLVPLMVVAMGPMMGLPFWQGMEWAMVSAITQLLLTMFILFFQRSFFTHGWKALVKRAPNMDSLVALGASAAFLYGLYAMYRMAYGFGFSDHAMIHAAMHSMYFESAAMIVTLVSLGKYLEARSKSKTSDALGKLVDLAPKSATVIRDGAQVEIDAEDVIEGDLVVIRPGERIPVDGVVESGHGFVDQAAITGESVPVEKEPGDNVLSATMNVNGSFRFRATKVGEDTTLAQIIRLVDEAGNSKAPIARLADKVSGVFVPVVIGIALLTWIVWMALGQSFEFALSNAISVLVISCPCALGLATPVAIMVGTGKAAENGILIKSAESLETMRRVDTIILDKTGTITSGHPSIHDIVLMEPGLSENEFLRFAGSVELGSEHPLAKAIVEEARARELPLQAPDKYEALSGKGLKAWIDDSTVVAGNVKMMAESGLALPKQALAQVDRLAKQGETPLIFARDRVVLGIIGVADTVRASSAQAIRLFQQHGIHVVMLTGDNAQTAQAIAKEVAVDEVIADVLPTEKENVVRRFQDQGKFVAMVGDGINDAPALARANIGIAIGAGTDIAIDSADIVLMKNNLMDVNTAYALSEKVVKNIKMNLFWAFFYNVLGIPVAAGVFYPLWGLLLSPMIGSAAMSLSSVCVVLNALRLRFFKPPYESVEEQKESAKAKIHVEVDPIESNPKEEKKMKKVMIVDGMSCNHCKKHVEEALEKIAGVQSAVVDLDKKEAVITMDAPILDDTLMNAVKEAGYEPKEIL